MQHRIRNSRVAFCAVIGIVFVLLGASAQAAPITLGSFQEFSFGDAGTSAVGCFPADPSGNFCVESSGTVTGLLGAPPWTFAAPAGGATLTLTDAFLAGDSFQILDFGAPIGLTSAPFGDADCGDDPVPCLSTAGISSGIFALAAGNHSL